MCRNGVAGEDPRSDYDLKRRYRREGSIRTDHDHRGRIGGRPPHGQCHVPGDDGRHGEKPADPRNPDLTPTGVQRADMLAKVIPQTFGRPDFLFASAPSKHSNRPVETLTPLAKALTMSIDTDIADNLAYNIRRLVTLERMAAA
jgi:hypothetical protein